MNGYYLQDLEQYLKLMNELNNSLMTPTRRSTLETCKEALDIILDTYELNYK